MARVHALVLEHGWNATAYQILNPGFTYWLSPHGDAAVGYVVRAGVRVVAGAPVCAPDRLPNAVAEFTAHARASEERVCFFAAGERLALLLGNSAEWSVAGLGAQPWWDPAGWPSIVVHHRSLRAQLHRAANKGVHIETWPAARALEHPTLRRLLREWLATRALPPLHFLVEPHTLGRLADRRVYVAVRASRPVGYLVASPVPARAGWLIEQIIRGHGAPNGTAELLIDAAMRALHAEGARWVTLGLAPLSRHARFDPRRMPWWLRATLGWVRAHGRRFYHFDGLDHFKAKFDPHGWEEIVALAGAPRFPPRALWAIASAFSNGSPVVLMARALGRAVRQEAHWLAARSRR